jgi:DNA-directed RNA polymerase specialized sigma24 family protein
MAPIRRAAKKVERLERELEAARQEYRQAILDRYREGHTQASIAEELGVSRQRIRSIIDRLGRPNG